MLNQETGTHRDNSRKIPPTPMGKNSSTLAYQIAPPAASTMAPAASPAGAQPSSIYVFAAPQHSHLVPYMAALQGTCITVDHMTGAFLPPLNHEKLLAWWKERIADAAAGRVAILFLLDESEPGTRPKGAELVGVALLSLPASETSPFRGHVESLLVGSRYRRSGRAVQLMRGVHAEAVKRNRTLLTAEAQSGSAGEALFKKLGYTEVGRVPNYSLSPADMKKRDQTMLYLELGD
ncbi:hypothetical protein RB594_009927 [Gaeumannomyces avenae]